MKDLVVFCDFDGTITQEDLGDNVFREFGKIDPYREKLKNREIDIYEYWHKLCEHLESGTDPEKIRSFAREKDIDPYFKRFYEMCKESEIPFYILSDGYDIYIEEVLAKEGLAEIEYYSNRLIFEAGRFRPEFANASDSCECFSASCKRNLAINKMSSEAISIYIGDGYSDFCGAEHCDIIFAKKTLARYCNSERLPHYPWRGFYDIIRIFKEQILAGKAKQRNEAKTKRKRAIESE